MNSFPGISLDDSVRVWVTVWVTVVDPIRTLAAAHICTHAAALSVALRRVDTFLRLTPAAAAAATIYRFKI